MDPGRLRRHLARLTPGPTKDPDDHGASASFGGLSIFINYRRTDSAGVATFLYEALSSHFGEQRVFVDIALDPGSDWAESIRRAVDSFTIVLAVIGPSWGSAADDRGLRRLDDPEDAVRIELESALERSARVIPVLVDGAMMPTDADLPPSLKPLAHLNAFALSPGRLDDDVAALIATLDRLDEAAADVPWGAVEPLRGDSG
jgi:TIR domain